MKAAIRAKKLSYSKEGLEPLLELKRADLSRKKNKLVKAIRRRSVSGPDYVECLKKIPAPGAENRGSKMKKKEILLTLTSLELKRLEFLASEVLREYNVKVSLQQLTRALMQLALGDEPPEGFSTSKGKFGLVGIISNFKGVGQNDWEQEKKIEEALETNLNNLKFEEYLVEYKKAYEKAKRKGRFTKKEEERLKKITAWLDKEIEKSKIEEAKVEQWRREGKYRSRRHKYE